MSVLHFTDNTVPINFSLIGEIPLLRTLLNSRGTWTGAVQAEFEASVATGLYPGLEQVSGFITETILAEPEETTRARGIRLDIARPDEPFPKSFGEAETLAVILNRGMPALFLTDDGGAATYVEERAIPIKIVTTSELLALAVEVRLITVDTGRDHVLDLMSQGRGVSLRDYEAALM